LGDTNFTEPILNIYLQMRVPNVISMNRVETADTLTLIGAILSTILGPIYLLVGIFSAAYRGSILNWILFVFPWVVSMIAIGILSLISGILTFFTARKKLSNGDLKIGGILCIIFGGISSPAIGGILTIVAGILALIAWNEQRRTQVASSPPPSPSQLTAATLHIACTVVLNYCEKPLTVRHVARKLKNNWRASEKYVRIARATIPHFTLSSKSLCN
jgi:hypothetical protein